MLGAYPGPYVSKALIPVPAAGSAATAPRSSGASRSMGSQTTNISGRRLNILRASRADNGLGRPDFIAMDVDTDSSLPYRLVRCLPYTVAWSV